MAVAVAGAAAVVTVAAAVAVVVAVVTVAVAAAGVVAAVAAATKPPHTDQLGRAPSGRPFCFSPYRTPSSSTSKISVAFGGITPPAPRAP